MRNVFHDLVDYVKVNKRLEDLQQERFEKDDTLLRFLTKDLSKKKERKALNKALHNTKIIDDQIRREEDKRDYIEFCLRHPIKAENVSLNEFNNCYFDDEDMETRAPEVTSHEDHYLD